jgi:hypothetical protein
MKIVDILNEATPGASKTIAAKRKSVNWIKKQVDKLRPEDTIIAKQNRKKWYDTVKKLQKAGTNMTDEQVYRKFLYAFLSSNNKVKLPDALKKQIGTAELTDRSVLDIMSKALVARRMAKEA